MAGLDFRRRPVHASSAQPARPGFLNHDESSGPHQSCGTQQLMAHLRQTPPHPYPTLTSSPASPTYFLRADLAMRSSRVPFPDNRSPKPISLRAKTRLSFVNSAHPPPVPQISHPPRALPQLCKQPSLAIYRIAQARQIQPSTPPRSSNSKSTHLADKNMLTAKARSYYNSICTTTIQPSPYLNRVHNSNRIISL